jgi:hypothetical protein
MNARAQLAAVALIALAVAQPIADIAAMPRLKAVLAATQVAPAMKVFTAQQGFETYASRYFISWREPDGRAQRIELTPQIYGRMQGPYNRRNVYGAALSYGPVLRSSAQTRPMADSVAAYAFCTPGGLLRELRLTDAPPSAVEIELVPRREPARKDYELSWSVACE